MKCAIVGNPNCGKTTIFNKLTNLDQRVGNWNGVTVDKVVGKIRIGKQKFELIDLPGIYSLNLSEKNALDEQISTNFILHTPIDIIINVVDASDLEKNLYLTLQLIETDIPVIIVVKMVDLAIDQGLSINYGKLSHILGCPVLVVDGKNDFNQLKKTLELPIKKNSFSLDYGNRILKFISITKEEESMSVLKSIFCITEEEKLIQRILSINSYKLVSILKRKYLEEDDDVIIINTRYKKIQSIILSVVFLRHKVRKYDINVSEYIDKIVMNKFLGIPVLLLVILSIFQTSSFSGIYFDESINYVSSNIIIPLVRYILSGLHFPSWFINILHISLESSLITIINFIPQIGTIFLLLSFLEESGYITRATFVIDRFMELIGLTGKSFIPLVLGFGCNVPSVIATRNLDQKNHRLITMLMAPFMSCSARLTIFAVFSSTFFPKKSGVINFYLYLIGVLGAILTGYVLKFFILNDSQSNYVTEIPKYRIPSMRFIVKSSYKKLLRFIYRTSKMIIPVCILISFLNTIQIDGKIVSQGSDKCVLSQVGKSLTPIFYPIGIDKNNWQATVGLISGIVAKEAVIGTLNSLYEELSIDETITDSKNFRKNFVEAFGSNSSVFSYMLFILLYIPCISTISAIARESSSWWACISMIWNISIAYFFSTLYYQITNIKEHPIFSLGCILLMMVYMVLLVSIIKLQNERKNSLESRIIKNQTCKKNCC